MMGDIQLDKKVANGLDQSRNELNAELKRAEMGPGGRSGSPNQTVIHDNADLERQNELTSNFEPSEAATAAAATDKTVTAHTTSESDRQFIDQSHLDAECERLLRNAKRQVKQMMEEAVTKKFIHEDSSSIIALCVSIDACLSHGLKRRALGLFKTNSSTALVQKIAKSCPDAQKILNLAEEEEKRQMEELKQVRKQSQAQEGWTATVAATTAHKSPKSPCRQPRVASNLHVHRRNLWIKYALIEKKLVNIVEHLAANATKYYESNALMANCVTAQLFCSLLVGPCALEFSGSKTNDFYQFEEPSADELLKRHKLSNPIACLYSAPNNNSGSIQAVNAPLAASGAVSGLCRRHWKSQQAGEPARLVGRCKSASLNQHLSQAQALARSDTDRNNNTGAIKTRKKRNRRATTSQATTTSFRADSNELHIRGAPLSDNEEASAAGRSSSPSALVRRGSRRRPLALKTNIRTGALVTECHHYCCQDINEHQKTRGYSFKSGSSTNGLGARALASANQNQQQQHHHHQQHCIDPPIGQGQSGNTPGGSAKSHMVSSFNDPEAWPMRSPRMLHETLHQNSKSSLLYAKNNVLLETQAHGLTAGYLSLHQTCDDLILKWIPNQLINGGHHQKQQPSNGFQPNRAKQQSCPCESVAVEDDANSCQPDSNTSVGQRAHSLENVNKGEKVNGENVELSCDHARRMSSNVVDLRERTKSLVAVGGSFLDLVISLSVSRIVLLHCHFCAPLCQPDQAANNIAAISGKSEPEAGKKFDELNLGRREAPTPRASIEHHQAPDVSSSCHDEHETLVLVEVDGVQRAPFKFPRGGLRWFLSCLDCGLRPDKYLDPAIKLDISSGPDSDQATTQLPDPLQQVNVATSVPLRSSEISSGFESVQTSTSSETASRLDFLLSRLPSLRRRSGEKVKPDETPPTAMTTDSSQASSRVTSPEPTSGKQQQQQQQQSQQNIRTMPLNYVYRIVSNNNQCELAMQTPPLSALSLASSSGSSFVLTAGRSMIWTRKQQSAGDPDTWSTGQKFRWSLSRLARFSSRGGSTSSSSMGGTGANNVGSLVSNQQATIDSLGSFDGDSLDNQQACGSSMAPGASNMKRDSSSELVRIESKLNSLKKTSSQERMALRDQSILTLCEQMRKQILARAFYGWLAYCRRMKIIRNHLVQLVKLDELGLVDEMGSLSVEVAEQGLTRQTWTEIMSARGQTDEKELARRISQLIYYGGVENNELRVEVWPYLLGHYQYGDTRKMRMARDESCRLAYETCWRDWIKVERVIKRRDRQILAANMAKVARKQKQPEVKRAADEAAPNSQSETSEDFHGTCALGQLDGEIEEDEIDEDYEECDECGDEEEQEEEEVEDEDEFVSSSLDSKLEQSKFSDRRSSIVEELDKRENDQKHSNDEGKSSSSAQASNMSVKLKQLRDKRKRQGRRRFRLESTGSVGSDASITDQFGNNIHRIDKDVQRCDRNFWYFKEATNLEKLRNIMCSYVWQHLDVGYVQGMCDLAAPFLVIFDDEIKAFNCFSQLMKRMVANFPHGSAMDKHFESLKYLMQVLDPKLFEVLQSNGDYTHFYFCYRWLLLDFKRELAYEDVYRVWETIWSARRVATDHFVVFLALAMVRYYRDIIIENNMDFTDTIKFFNEMAERHDVKSIIALAQDSIMELETLIRD